MHVAEADIATGNGSKYLQQLCKHWSHRFTADFKPSEGRVDFGDGTACVLRADAETLHVEVESPDGDQIGMLEEVVIEHLKRFAHREDLGDPAWRITKAEDPPAPPATPFDFIQAMTRKHQAEHRCGAYTFKDGPGLIAMAQTHKPVRVLECGTALGYTACCLASATPATRVDTIEFDEDHVRLARDNVAKAGLGERVAVHHGDFAKIVPTLEGQYDMAFFDGFAPELAFLQVLRGKVREGGVLACANLHFVEDRKAVEAELANASRWRPVGSLEGGGTRAFVKLGTD